MQRLIDMRCCTFGLLLALMLAASCITKDGKTSPPSNGETGTSHPTASATAPHWVLVRTDLGLGDGSLARLADAELQRQADAGVIRYTPVGELPKPLEHEAGGADVGLPVPHSKNPGEMTLTEAEALLDTVPECGVLVVSSGYLAEDALKVAREQAHAKALLALDEQGMPSNLSASAVPVYRIHYDVKPLAYLAGIAAADSAVNSHFGVLYAADDPQGQEFAEAVKAGAKYHSNGAWTEIQSVPVDPLGYITADQFRESFAALKKQGGPNWKPDHYILALGRSTPTVMNALSKKPENAYLVGAYADYRAVRPARVVGCVLKQPDKALAALFSRLDTKTNDLVASLKAVAPDGVFTVGMDEDAVGFTDFSLYKQYNNDGADIEEAVTRSLAQIRTGEIGLQD